MVTKKMFVQFGYALCCSAIVLLTAACTSAKDEPMPLTQNNIEKYSKRLASEAKNVDPSAGTAVDKTIKVFKTSMYKMGYSLDKSIRYLMININQISGSPATNQYFHIMAPAYESVIDKPEEALQKGLISQKTFDLITLGKTAGEPISDEQYKYINVAIDCQKGNNNICPMSKFKELLVQRGLLPQDLLKKNVDMIDFRTLTSDFMNKSDLQGWGTRGWVLQANGEKIDHGIFLDQSKFTFIVNTQKIEATKKYGQLLAEEQRALANK